MEKFDLYYFDFSFDDSNEIKVRPVLIIDNDGSFVEIAKITKHKSRNNYDYEIINWRESGLKCPSTIRFNKTASVYKNSFGKYIGHLSDDDIKNINKLNLIEGVIMGNYSKFTDETEFRVKGYTNRWGIIDSKKVKGKEYLLLGNNTYGDETCCLLVDSSKIEDRKYKNKITGEEIILPTAMEVVCETFDDIDTVLTALADEGLLTEDIIPDEDGYYIKQTDDVYVDGYTRRINKIQPQVNQCISEAIQMIKDLKDATLVIYKVKNIYSDPTSKKNVSVLINSNIGVFKLFIKYKKFNSEYIIHIYDNGEVKFEHRLHGQSMPDTTRREKLNTEYECYVALIESFDEIKTNFYNTIMSTERENMTESVEADNIYKDILNRVTKGISTSNIKKDPNTGLFNIDIEPSDKSINKAQANLESIGFKEVDEFIDEDDYMNDSYIVFIKEDKEGRIVASVIFNASEDFAYVACGYDEEYSDYFTENMTESVNDDTIIKTGNIIVNTKPIFYCTEENLDFFEDDVIDKFREVGFINKDHEFVIPIHTRFKVVDEAGPGSGWPVLDIMKLSEVTGEPIELDFVIGDGYDEIHESDFIKVN